MNPMQAIQAYSQIQNGVSPTGIGGGVGGAGPVGGSEFSQMLQSVVGDMTQQSRAAETQMAAAVQGQGSLIDVVTAISSAEASLETVMAVRDQVIQAYQEIMRMPI